MGEMKKAFNRAPHWLGKTIAAGVLACAIIPGSAFALASYDAGAFFEFTSVTADDGVTLLYAVDDDTVNTSSSGNASIDDAYAIPAFNDDTDLAGITPNEVRVTGSASPTVGGSISSADASSSVSITAIAPEAGQGEGGVSEVVFDYIYGLDALASLDDALLESVFASVSVVMDTVFGGAGEPGGEIINATLEFIGAGQDAQFFQGSYTLRLQPGEFNGVYVDLLALGQAISVAEEPTPGIPVPATLALLGIGLLGLASRRRRAAA